MSRNCHYFDCRPKAFNLKYLYVPGSENTSKQGNPVKYGDAFDIYLLLEVRNSSSSKRPATAWFRSDESKNGITQLDIPLLYGVISADEYGKKSDGQYVRADSAEFILPSHLTFAATSSFDMANFAGAMGCKLIIDDLEVIYE